MSFGIPVQHSIQEIQCILGKFSAYMLCTYTVYYNSAVVSAIVKCISLQLMDNVSSVNLQGAADQDCGARNDA